MAINLFPVDKSQLLAYRAAHMKKHELSIMLDRAAFYRRLAARIQSGELTEEQALTILDEKYAPRLPRRGNRPATTPYGGCP